jgi:hypothetical protein
MTYLISLMGEQPYPNLMVCRHVRPEAVLLVSTARTVGQHERLKRQLQTDGIKVIDLYGADAYAAGRLSNCLQEETRERRWATDELVADITGGTKLMALGAFDAIQALGARCIYFETTASGSQVHWLTFASGGRIVDPASPQPVQAEITIDDYLRLYLDNGYQTREFANPMERAVAAAFMDDEQGRIDEAKFNIRPTDYPAAEVDFIVRSGQRIGIGEVKRTAGMAGAVHVTSIGEQRHLGTYVEKFLISAQPIDKNNLDVCKAYRVKVIELKDYDFQAGQSALSDESRRLLLGQVTKALGATSD